MGRTSSRIAACAPELRRTLLPQPDASNNREDPHCIVQLERGSWPGGLPKKDGARALSGAGSVDTATTRVSKTSRTKNLIIELIRFLVCGPRLLIRHFIEIVFV